MISGLTEPPTARLLCPHARPVATEVIPVHRQRISRGPMARSSPHQGRAKARDLFEALGARGKLEELKPRLKPLRSRPHLRPRRHVIICSACRDILATVAARVPSRRGQVAGSGSPCLRRTFGLAAAPPQRRGCVLY